MGTGTSTIHSNSSNLRNRFKSTSKLLYEAQECEPLPKLSPNIQPTPNPSPKRPRLITHRQPRETVGHHVRINIRALLDKEIHRLGDRLQIVVKLSRPATHEAFAIRSGIDRIAEGASLEPRERESSLSSLRLVVHGVLIISSGFFAQNKGQ